MVKRFVPVFALALIIVLSGSQGVFAQGINLGTTTPGPVSEESEPVVEEREVQTEEIDGLVEAVSETLIVLNRGENDNEVRKIQIGNRSAVNVVRDGEAATLEDVTPGDAAIVRYTTGATYPGEVLEASATILRIRTIDGRELEFVPGENLSVKFQVQPGVKATGPGLPQIVAGFTPGSEIEAIVRGESVIEVEAYSSGEFPREGNWIIPLLALLILIVLGGILYIRRKRKRHS